MRPTLCAQSHISPYASPFSMQLSSLQLSPPSAMPLMQDCYITCQGSSPLPKSENIFASTKQCIRVTWTRSAKAFAPRSYNNPERRCNVMLKSKNYSNYLQTTLTSSRNAIALRQSNNEPQIFTSPVRKQRGSPMRPKLCSQNHILPHASP